MDGEWTAGMSAETLSPDGRLSEPREVARATPARPHTVRWFVIVALLLTLVLGGLYGFNRFRQQAMATYFAANKPPPAQISAVEATTEAVQRFADWYRLGGCHPSGDDQPRGRRARHQDLFRAGRVGESR